MGEIKAKIKNLVSMTALVVFGICGSFFILEISVRAIFPRNDTTFVEYNPNYGYYHIPKAAGSFYGSDYRAGIRNYVEINSNGLRDVEHTYKKPAEVYRILILGDSFTEALAVPLEKTFPRLLEAKLNQSHGSKYEIVSAGIRGFGTAQNLLFFEYEGYKYEPDLVILMFFAGNDVRDDSYTLSSQIGDIYHPYFVINNKNNLELINFPSPIPPTTKVEEKPSFVKRIVRASNLYWFVSKTIQDRLPVVTETFIQLGIWSPQVRKNKAMRGLTFATKDGIPVDFGVYQSEYTGEWQSAWKLEQKLISQLQTNVLHKSSKLAVIVIPFSYSIRGEWSEELLKTYPEMRKVNWDLTKPHTLINDILESENISHYDLISDLNAFPTNKIFIPYDEHFSQQGHQVVANLMYEYLMQSELLRESDKH